MEDKALARLKKDMDKDSAVLTLDNIHLVKITEKLRDRIQAHTDTITTLSMAVCRLFSLANFPQLPKLRSLNLNDNKIKDDDIKALADLKNLKYLSLCGNQIKNVESLSLLAQNGKMKMIDLLGNPCANHADYRKRLFEIFPNLQLVDYQDRLGKDNDSYQQSDDTEEEEEEVEGEGEGEMDEFIEKDPEDGQATEGGQEQPDGEGEDDDESGEEEEEDDDEASQDHANPPADHKGVDHAPPNQAEPPLPSAKTKSPARSSPSKSPASPDPVASHPSLQKRLPPPCSIEADRETKRVAKP